MVLEMFTNMTPMIESISHIVHIIHQPRTTPKKMTFGGGTHRISDIRQNPPYNPSWTKFILDKSEGFTQTGVERLNDSIRTYVWAILGAQALTKTGILGTGTAFDAQKQFTVNVEDAISAPVSIPDAITRYQNLLQNASSKVDFVFGIGLYMAPSDMLLNIGQIAG